MNMNQSIRKKLEDLFERYLKQIQDEKDTYEKMYLIDELLTRQHKLEEEGNWFWTTDYILHRLAKCI